MEGAMSLRKGSEHGRPQKPEDFYSHLCDILLVLKICCLCAPLHVALPPDLSQKTPAVSDWPGLIRKPLLVQPHVVRKGGVMS